MRKLQPPQLTDERFIAQLGIVSIQSRIDDDHPLNRRWTSTFQIADVSYHIEGFAADFGRPRGVDTDILMALETLFIAEGCPADNMIQISANELIRMVYGYTSGQSYDRLKQSLLRLWRVGFMVRKAYLQPESTWGRYLNMSLNLLESVQFWTEGDARGDVEDHFLEEESQLVIRLSEPLAQSIRAGYVHYLDRELLKSIDQPVARALYRILQAHRPDSQKLEVALMDWAALCGIISDRPDKIRRILETAHEELLANNYLESATFEGRGQKQRVVYEFRPVGSGDIALVRMLTELGVARGRAEELVLNNPDRIESVVAYVQRRMNSRGGKRVKYPAALTVDILANPDKYVLPDVDSESEAQGAGTKRSNEALAAEEARAEAEYEEQHQKLLEASPEDQWEASKGTLRLLVRSHLKEDGFARLQADCLAGRVSAVQLVSDLTRLRLEPEGIANYLERWLS